jgi:hypothetical protein
MIIAKLIAIANPSFFDLLRGKSWTEKPLNPFFGICFPTYYLARECEVRKPYDRNWVLFEHKDMCSIILIYNKKISPQNMF